MDVKAKELRNSSWVDRVPSVAWRVHCPKEMDVFQDYLLKVFAPFVEKHPFHYELEQGNRLLGPVSVHLRVHQH